MRLFEVNGWPSETHAYVFNGDYVDCGPHSAIVATLLLALQAALPSSVFVGRGNHEASDVNDKGGFLGQLCYIYYDGARELFNLFNSVFHGLPIAHVVAQRYFVVHAGLPEQGATMTRADIEKLKRRIAAPPMNSTLTAFLWSDPKHSDGVCKSPRSDGVLFGPDVTASFLALNGLARIVRSHEYVYSGYCEAHDGRCITVFSSPRYKGDNTQGAVINLTRPVGGEPEQRTTHKGAFANTSRTVSVRDGLVWEVLYFGL